MFVQHLRKKRRLEVPEALSSIERKVTSFNLADATKGNSMGGGPGVVPSGDGEGSTRIVRFFDRVVNGEFGDLRGCGRIQGLGNQLPRNERELGGHDENGEKPSPRVCGRARRRSGGAGCRSSR